VPFAPCIRLLIPELPPFPTYRAYGLVIVKFVHAAGTRAIRWEDPVAIVLLAVLSVYVRIPILCVPAFDTVPNDDM
jgi:hypothetical protein